MHHGAEHKTDVGLLQSQCRHNLRRVQSLDRDGHVGMLDSKQLDGVRQNFIAERQYGQYAKFLGIATRFQVDREALHFIKLRKQAFDVRVQRKRFRRRGQPALGPLEQGETQLQLRMLQDAAYRGLGDIDQARSSAHTAGKHDGVEDFNVAQAHGCFSCPVSD